MISVLFIGGTGTISQAITRALVAKGEEVILVNRGNRNAEFEGKVKQIRVHDVNDEEEFMLAVSSFLESEGAEPGKPHLFQYYFYRPVNNRVYPLYVKCPRSNC